MTLDIKQFERLPFPINAVRVTQENMAAVAEWCGGEILHTQPRPDRPSSPYIKVAAHSPMTHRQSKAFAGDWVSVRGKDFKVYTNGAFERNYGAPQNTELNTDPEESDAAKELLYNIFAEAGVPKPGPAVFRKDM